MTKCKHCGFEGEHLGVCPMIKAIEYYENGSVKRVEYKTAADYPQPSPYPYYHYPAPTLLPTFPQVWPNTYPYITTTMTQGSCSDKWVFNEA